MSEDSNKPTVMIVDDDEFLVNMYATKFENEGYEVDTMTTTQKALDTLKEGKRPDIIVLDIIMPDVDGLEALQQMRDNDLAPGSNVVMLTNQGGDEQIDKAKEFGAAGYIVKATSIPSEVVKKVQEIANSDQ